MGWTIALELAFYVALAIPCGYYFYVVTGPLQNEKFELTNNISKIQQKYDYMAQEVQMIAAYSALEVSRIVQIGSIFLPSKLSETLVTDDEILQLMNVTREHLDKEQYLGREGILMLSVYPLSVQRKHGSKYASFPQKSSVIKRLKSHGIVVYNDIVDDNINTLAATKVVNEALIRYFRSTERQHEPNTKTLRLPLEINVNSVQVIQSIFSFAFEILDGLLGNDNTLVDFTILHASESDAERPLQPRQKCYEIKDKKMYANEKVYSIAYFPDGLDDNLIDTTFEFIPGSTTYTHFLDDAERQLLKSVPIVQTHVPKGSVLLFDSCMFHRLGSFSRSGRSAPGTTRSKKSFNAIILSFKRNDPLLETSYFNGTGNNEILETYKEKNISLRDLWRLKTPQDIALFFDSREQKM